MQLANVRTPNSLLQTAEPGAADPQTQDGKKDFLDLPMRWGDGTALPSWNTQSSALMLPKRNRPGWAVNVHELFCRFGLANGKKAAEPQTDP